MKRRLLRIEMCDRACRPGIERAEGGRGEVVTVSDGLLAESKGRAEHQSVTNRDGMSR
jgi:hypothetical protein